MTAVPLSHLATSRRWQTNFMNVLPTVETHASVCFRHLRGDALAEAIAQAIASACQSYATLVRQGKLSRVYVGSLANYAVKAVNSFRVVGGRQSARCVMNPLTQKCHGVAVKSLSPWSRKEGDWREMAVESRRASPAETACFRLDFEEWLKQWPKRHRRIINALASGGCTMAVAERFAVSQARISQLRRKYERSWLAFQGMDGVNVAA
jgi:hypothetical protein